MLVLSRKVGEVLEFDYELYVEIANVNGNCKAEVYVYDRTNDIEYLEELSYYEDVEIKWNNKSIILKIAERFFIEGKKQLKIGIEAEEDILVLRKDKIDYLNGFEAGYFEDNIDSEEYGEGVKYKDSLVDRYKEELSWFYS